ncbi:MAG: sigma-54-dependent Fis family transcriptional regulator [Gemmatales bacterium]|nr:sigma-54-dependent Fis family transcriptional regulator [Gemmatales bacterium]MDW8221980.1 sigma 54-interacting transcriptional regulator [Gemmatales bacterium]
MVGQRGILLTIGLGVCIYGVAVVWYAAQATEIGFQAAFGTQIHKINYAYLRDEPNPPPEVGDQILAVGPQRIQTFSDFIRALADIRSVREFPRLVVSPDQLTREALETLPQKDTHILVYGDEEWVRVQYRKADGRQAAVWCLVGTTPPEEFTHSLLWFVVKLGLFGVVALVMWRKPQDDAVRRFYVLCVVTIGAFMGGYHWYRIASSPPLVVLFMICAALLPVVSLHFYLVFPRRKAWLERWPRLILGALYGVPLALLTAKLATYLLLVWTYRFGTMPDKVARVQSILGWLMAEIYVGVFLSATLFLGCVASLAQSFWTSQPGSRERKQLQWILAGALIALGLVVYTVTLAILDAERFSLGGATWPMFLASLCFTLAYGISISRYGMMEVGQVFHWGLARLLLGALAGLVYTGLVFVVALMIGSRGESHSPFRQAVLVSLTAWLLLMVMDWVRWRLRQAIHLRFYREKSQLDRTLQRMSQALAQLVDVPTLCRQLLQVLVEGLDARRAALYLRDSEGGELRLSVKHGDWQPPESIAADAAVIQAAELECPLYLPWTPFRVLTPAQRQLEQWQTHLAVPLTYEGVVKAIVLVARAEPYYDAEDGHLLRAFAQMAALALHSAQTHQRIEILNRELQQKVEKISEQQRRIHALQNQLLRQSEASPALSATSGEREGLASSPAATESAARPDTVLVGSSARIQELNELIRKVAASPAAVLIRGESGTGKELVARAIHELSPRREKPFVKVHCAALSPTLLESELFGHVKGAFTGAHRDKVGRFELAHGGTLFLDEIGDIALDVQTKLLRVLQEMTFERVGSSEPIRVDVRIVAATHQDLERLMREGRFREDLFYRLNVITLRTPSLREHREDLYELALHFLRIYNARCRKSITHIDDEVLELFKAYDWPGNVRELEHVIERAVVLAEGSTLTVRELPPELVFAAENALAAATHTSQTQPRMRPAPEAVPSSRPWHALPQAEWQTLQAIQERERLLRALHLCGGNKSRAARLLRMPRSTFLSKLEKYGLVRRDDRAAESAG